MLSDIYLFLLTRTASFLQLQKLIIDSLDYAWNRLTLLRIIRPKAIPVKQLLEGYAARYATPSIYLLTGFKVVVNFTLWEQG